MAGRVETSARWHSFMPADDPEFPWTMFLGGVLCVSVFYCAANQFIVQRTLAAKSEWPRMGVVFADYLKFLMPLVIVMPGLVVPRLYPHLEPAEPWPRLPRPCDSRKSVARKMDR